LAPTRHLRCRPVCLLTRPFAGAHRRNAFEGALAKYLEPACVQPLAIAHVDGNVAPGQLVWLDQALHFKGVGAAAWSTNGGRASFSGKLDVDASVTVTGEFNVGRVTSPTAAGMLSGRRLQFLLGYVQEATPSRISLRPIFIGQRMTMSSAGHQLDLRDIAHVWPGSVDQFVGVDFASRLTAKDLQTLKSVPEEQIKTVVRRPHRRADRSQGLGRRAVRPLDQPVVRRWTALRAAIAFKGPAIFRPMTIADLGKNGDQIDRLAGTGADLLVLQHCHTITAPVVNMLRTYATQPHRVRSYMTIDGYDTVRILRHFGYLE
jgi:hypothetical protein